MILFVNEENLFTEKKNTGMSFHTGVLRLTLAESCVTPAIPAGVPENCSAVLFWAS